MRRRRALLLWIVVAVALAAGATLLQCEPSVPAPAPAVDVRAGAVAATAELHTAAPRTELPPRAALGTASSPNGLRLIDACTDKPVVDCAGIRLIRGDHSEDVATDAEGRLGVELDGAEMLAILVPNCWPAVLMRDEAKRHPGLDDTGTGDLRIFRAGRLEVRVLDHGGRPLIDAQVDVQPSPAWLKRPSALASLAWPEFGPRHREGTLGAVPAVFGARTDRHGTVVFEPMILGIPLEVTARHRFLDLSSPLRTDPCVGEAVHELRSDPTSRVQGRLLWSDGAHAAAVEVSCRDSILRRERLMGISDEQGLFRAEGLPRGLLTWRVAVAEQPWRETQLDAELVDLGTVTLERPTTLDVQLSYRRAVLGPGIVPTIVRVLREGAVVAARRPDQDGHAVLPVAAGICEVAVDVNGRTLVVKDAVVPGPTVEIDLDATSAVLELRDLPVDLKGDLTIRLVTREVNGDAAEYVPNGVGGGATLRPAPSLFVRNEDGSASFHLRPPGTWNVLLGFGRAPTVSAGAVTLVAGETTSLSVRGVDARGAVEVVVLDESGMPMPRVSVGIARSDDPRRSAFRALQGTTDAAGRVRIDQVPVGEHLAFTVHSKPGTTGTALVRVEAGATATAVLKVPGVGALELDSGLKEARPGAKFRIVPISDMRGPDTTISLNADEQGQARVEGLVAGGYDVACVAQVARGAEQFWSQTRKVTIEPGKIAKVRFTPGEQRTCLRFMLDGQEWNACVRGRVVRLDGSDGLWPELNCASGWSAVLRPGRMLFVCEGYAPTTELAVPESGRCVFAWSELGDADAAAGVALVQIGGGKILVTLEAGTAGARLPQAEVLDVRGMPLRFEHPVCFRDLPGGSREFYGLVPGMRLRLRSEAGSAAVTREVEIEDEGTISVRWP